MPASVIYYIVISQYLIMLISLIMYQILYTTKHNKVSIKNFILFIGICVLLLFMITNEKLNLTILDIIMCINIIIMNIIPRFGRKDVGIR